MPLVILMCLSVWTNVDNDVAHETLRISQMPRSRKPDAVDVKGLPQAINAEKIILGAILLQGARYALVAGAITPEVFALNAHKLIWGRMTVLAARGDAIDKLTIIQALSDAGELEAAGGFSGITELDTGTPSIDNLTAWVKIIVEKWRLRAAVYAAQKTINQVMSGEYSADEVSLSGQAMLAEMVDGQKTGFGSGQIESAKEFVETFPGGINKLLSPWTADPGIPTGLRELDLITDGFHATEIFLVGARPASGKTALAAGLAKNIAREGKTVAIFSMELSKQMFLQRMICEEAYTSYARFRRGDMDETERMRVRQSTSDVMDMPIYIDEMTGLRVADIRVKLNKIARTRPVDLMVIDYAQLLKPPKGAHYVNENDKFTLIGEELKALTKSTGIPLLLLSQLNRESEKDKGSVPRLAQARGAGCWEEISFVGACLYREWLRNKTRDELADKAQLIVEKNRSGPARTVNLRFQDWLMRFGNAD